MSVSPDMRRQVLRCYKQLMRTREQIFANDNEALAVTRQEARKEFEKNRFLTDNEQIRKCIQIGLDSVEILKRTVIQARLNDRGNYEVEIKQHNLDVDKQ